ncbi:MAG: translesion error-prone DNA polymerase V autoproteolytic subunit [Cytophagales bacterium]|nr:translesion error-prone DNA polymerase V autoproteolytic subunit [Armatimonadota bacterium]
MDSGQSDTQYCSVPPLVGECVAAGFPSPAEGLVERRLDLNETLIRNPPSTFFVRVAGDSMVDVGIRQGDLLVVDRAIEPRDKQIIVARWGEEFTVKRLRLWQGEVWLVPENAEYSKLEVTGSPDFEIWGVVTGVVRSLLRPF